MSPEAEQPGDKGRKEALVSSGTVLLTEQGTALAGDVYADFGAWIRRESWLADGAQAYGKQDGLRVKNKQPTLGVVSDYPLISQIWKKDSHFQHFQMLKPPTHLSPEVRAYRQGATFLFHAHEFKDHVCPRSSEEGAQGLGGKDESAETNGNSR